MPSYAPALSADVQRRPRRQSLVAATGVVDMLPHVDVERRTTADDDQEALVHEFVFATTEFPSRPRIVTGSWLAEALHDIRRLTDLGDNWDGYGAPSIQIGTVISVLEFLRMTTRPTVMRPAIVPTGLGDIQVEWHYDGVEIDVEINAVGRYYASYVASGVEREWEGEIANGVDPDLALAIANLASPQP